MNVFGDIAVRAARTFAQTGLALIVAEATFLNLDWIHILDVSAIAAVGAVLMGLDRLEGGSGEDSEKVVYGAEVPSLEAAEPEPEPEEPAFKYVPSSN